MRTIVCAEELNLKCRRTKRRKDGYPSYYLLVPKNIVEGLGLTNIKFRLVCTEIGDLIILLYVGKRH